MYRKNAVERERGVAHIAMRPGTVTSNEPPSTVPPAAEHDVEARPAPLRRRMLDGAGQNAGAGTSHVGHPHSVVPGSHVS